MADNKIGLPKPAPELPQAPSRQRRSMDIDILQVCKDFAAYKAQRIQLTESEFAPYRILFNREALSEANLKNVKFKDRIHKLSSELDILIDKYQPFDVVSDSNPNQVLFTIPAIFAQVGALSGPEADRMIAYQNILAKNSDKPWEVQRATYEVLEGLSQAQGQGAIVKAGVEFMVQADKLHKQGVLSTQHVGPGQFVLQEAQAPDKTEAAPEESGDSLDGLDFEV